MNKKVMIVDNEGDIRTLVKEVLEKAGYLVISASSGDECLTMLKKEKPDLILMDIMMPGTSAKEIVEKINGVKIAYLSRVIITETEKERILLNPKIVGFIKKPFKQKEFIEEVEECLRG